MEKLTGIKGNPIFAYSNSITFPFEKILWYGKKRYLAETNCMKDPPLQRRVFYFIPFYSTHSPWPSRRYWSSFAPFLPWPEQSLVYEPFLTPAFISPPISPSRLKIRPGSPYHPTPIRTWAYFLFIQSRSLPAFATSHIDGYKYYK